MTTTWNPWQRIIDELRGWLDFGVFTWLGLFTSYTWGLLTASFTWSNIRWPDLSGIPWGDLGNFYTWPVLFSYATGSNINTWADANKIGLGWSGITNYNSWPLQYGPGVLSIPLSWSEVSTMDTEKYGQGGEWAKVATFFTDWVSPQTYTWSSFPDVGWTIEIARTSYP
jgi:hypothetical protein